MLAAAVLASVEQPAAEQEHLQGQQQCKEAQHMNHLYKVDFAFDRPGMRWVRRLHFCWLLMCRLTESLPGCQS